MGHALVLRLIGRRPDFGRAAQGFGIQGAEHSAANLDHREPSAQGGGCRLCHRCRAAVSARTCRIAGRCDCDVQLWRCLCQSFYRPRRVQCGGLDGVAGDSTAVAVCLRGQRHRNFHKDTKGLDRGEFLVSSGPALFQSRWAGFLRRLQGGAGGGRFRAPAQEAGGFAHSYHSTLRPCWGRRANHLSAARRG